MPDFRALCAELAKQLEGWQCYASPDGPNAEVLARARAALAQPEPDISQTSDGYHTFAELYEHRHALCLALMRSMPGHWWFSRRHADGELCFGGDEWFIIGADLPGLDDSSVTYHLPMRLWDAARATGVQELTKGRPWDGHSAQDVVDRFMLWASLAQPKPVGNRVAELETELERERLRLVACGVVAMADTPESAARARDMHPDYRSDSLDDVIRQIDALMELRSRLAQPKPPSLKEQALTALTRYTTGETILTNGSVDIIRRALEQLDD
jgi:hypothetical protein